MVNWRNRLENDSRMSLEDKALFLKFAADGLAKQVSDTRIEKYRVDVCMASEMSDDQLLRMVKDIKTLAATCAKINANKKYSPESKKNAKRTLGSIYCFYHTKERSLKYAPKEVKELVAHKIRAADKRLARPVITREEIRELSKFGNTMDRALLWLLFESGMRNGEFEQLKKSDIRQVEEGLIVRVPAGKTGEREVIVVEAVKYVNDWLEEHPIKDKETYLWTSPQTRKPFTQAGITRRIRLIAERLNEHRRKKGIPLFAKDVNPHNFRHSRATELGAEPGMTEQIMCKYFGWEIGSDMPRTYLHLTNEQVRKAVLATYGKAKPEEQKKIATAWVCPRCKESTPLGQNYCGRCGSSKEGKVISEVAALKAEIEEIKKSIAKETKEDLIAREKQKART